MSAYSSDCASIDPCGPCGTLPAGFVRLRYFFGKRMGVTDFVDEQRYHSGKLRFHNQRLHGAGVLCGLGVARQDLWAIQAEDHYVRLLLADGRAPLIGGRFGEMPLAFGQGLRQRSEPQIALCGIEAEQGAGQRAFFAGKNQRLAALRGKAVGPRPCARLLRRVLGAGNDMDRQRAPGFSGDQFDGHGRSSVDDSGLLTKR